MFNIRGQSVDLVGPHFQPSGYEHASQRHIIQVHLDIGRAYSNLIFV